MDHVGIAGQCMHQGSVQHMGRCVLVVVNWAILRRCARAGKTMQFTRWKWRYLRKTMKYKK